MIKPGDAVRVNRPDSHSGVSCILAGHDAAYEVTRVDGKMIFVRPHLPGMADEVFVWEQEVDVVAEEWWRGKKP